MKIFRLNERAQTPQFIAEGSSCFELKACLDTGTKVRCYNPLNKETQVPVRSISNKIGVQLYPMQRMLIPTGLAFDVPVKHVLKLYPIVESSLTKGVILGSGTGIVDSNYTEELFVILYNTSDAVAVIEDGECVARALLEQTITYDLEEVVEKPS